MNRQPRDANGRFTRHPRNRRGVFVHLGQVRPNPPPGPGAGAPAGPALIQPPGVPRNPAGPAPIQRRRVHVEPPPPPPRRLPQRDNRGWSRHPRDPTTGRFILRARRAAQPNAQPAARPAPIPPSRLARRLARGLTRGIARGIARRLARRVQTAPPTPPGRPHQERGTRRSTSRPRDPTTGWVLARRPRPIPLNAQPEARQDIGPHEVAAAAHGPAPQELPGVPAPAQVLPAPVQAEVIELSSDSDEHHAPPPQPQRVLRRRQTRQ